LGPLTGAEERTILSVEHLKANPNPLMHSALINYTIPAKGEVSLTIYDLTGRLVRTLVRGMQNPGDYKVRWDGKDDKGKELGNGIYFYKLTTQGVNDIKKTVILR